MKASYVKMRNSGKYDINWFHRYYTDKKGTMDVNMFHMIFNHGNLDQILEHLDKEFGLVGLYNKQNKLIKII